VGAIPVVGRRQWLRLPSFDSVFLSAKRLRHCVPSSAAATELWRDSRSLSLRGEPGILAE